VNNFEERDRVLEAVYGDSLRRWRIRRAGSTSSASTSRSSAKIAKGKGDEAERMFLNRKLAQSGAAFNIEAFKSLRRTGFRRAVPSS
jgi:hypothetical protein